MGREEGRITNLNLKSNLQHIENKEGNKKTENKSTNRWDNMKNKLVKNTAQVCQWSL